MHCKNIQQLLSERYARLLTRNERIKIERHLSTCQSCREVDDLLKLSTESVQELPEAQLPADFLSRLRSETPLRRLPAWSVWFRNSFGFGPSYIAKRVALVGVSVVLIFTGTAGVLQKKSSEQHAMEYLEACMDRHALYASTGPMTEDTGIDESSEENGKLGSLW